MARERSEPHPKGERSEPRPKGERIAIGCIAHETSAFSPVPTTLASADERFGYVRGEDLFTDFRGTNTPVGGFIEGGDHHGFELVPTIYWEAHPGGPLPADDFAQVVADLVDRITGAGSIQGVLLELHGSMVAEGEDDADGAILRAVRRTVGTLPIIVQLDIHSNVSAEMIEHADGIIVRETYPEVDQAERGRECADLMARVLRDGVRPAMALAPLPMIWGKNQITAHPPMRQAIERLHEIEERPGILYASISTCFPLADAPHVGSSVTVITDGNQDLAQRSADELAAWIFARRADWQMAIPTTAEVIDELGSTGPYPIVIADSNDNCGGGSPGDSTGMLRTFIERSLEDACVLYIVDPEAALACHRAGAGASLRMAVGGKSVPAQGAPIEAEWQVVAVSDGAYTYDGPMFAGLSTTLGPSAHVRTGDRTGGVHVIIVTYRDQPFDSALARSLGLHPRRMRYIGVKSTGHFRAHFEPFAGVIRTVNEPSVHDPTHIRYRNLGRPVYPLDPI
jgi:microcystin degradation protein MlrC